MEMKQFPTLIKKIKVNGLITLRTGLHIGASDVGLAVGGSDSVVVRNPLTNQPYIPGSSLKGKLRSLLERSGKAKGFGINPRSIEAPPCQCGHIDCVVCQLFGVSAANTDPAEWDANNNLKTWCGVGRLIVRDSFMSKESVKQLESSPFLDMPFTEVKIEVSIDRLTSKANPRNFERVPAGAAFDFEIVINIHDIDNEIELINTMALAFQLLQNDYLGGQGTRGYGAVLLSVTEVSCLDLTADWNEDLPWKSDKKLQQRFLPEQPKQQDA